MSCAVVPVKALSASKSRMLPDLDRSQLETLALVMLEDVLAALCAVPSLDRVVTLTPDATVARTARAAGAEALERPDTGLNAAIDAAARDLKLGRDEPFLVVLGDVPNVETQDIEKLCQAVETAGRPAAALAPSRDGGSAALLRAPHDAIPSCFGSDSARRHRDAARDRDVPFLELELHSLHLDLDRPEDLESFLATSRGGRATRAFLEPLDRIPRT